MDILANVVTPSQLREYLQAANGESTANQDVWCWVVSQITGASCPAYDIGNGPDVKTSAETFVEGLRNFELSYNATFQGPGGSGNTGGPVAALPGATSTTTASGAGLLGPTNCKFCIWLRQNIWAVPLIAAAIYFGFFYKSK